MFLKRRELCKERKKQKHNSRRAEFTLVLEMDARVHASVFTHLQTEPSPKVSKLKGIIIYLPSSEEQPRSVQLWHTHQSTNRSNQKGSLEGKKRKSPVNVFLFCFSFRCFSSIRNCRRIPGALLRISIAIKTLRMQRCWAAATLAWHTRIHTQSGSRVLSGQCRSLSPGEELPDWTVAHAKVDPSSSTNQVFRAIEIFSFNTVADLVVQWNKTTVKQTGKRESILTRKMSI